MIVAAGTLLGVVAPAFAQFQPLTPYPNAYNVPLYGNFNVNPVFNGTSGFLFSGVLPLSNGLGTRFTPGPGGVMSPTSFYIQPRTAPPLYSPGKLSNFGGGYLGVPESASQPVLDRQKREIAAAQANASFQAMTGEANAHVAKWVADQGNPSSTVDPLTAVDPSLIHPTEDALVSGLTLNELAARITALDAKGKRAKSGLCPPEFLEKIVFVGGPAADMLNLFQRPSKPSLPLSVPDGIAVEPLNQAYASVASSLFAGKRAGPAEARKLADAVLQLRTAMESHISRSSIEDAGRWLSFFNAMERVAKFCTESDAAGVLVPKWSSVGSNVSDLVKHMSKASVRFGRAAAGDELVYATLHRAMLAHYAAAAVAK
jgi:hypothetical protein